MGAVYSDAIYDELRALAASGPVGIDEMKAIARRLLVDLEHVIAHAWDLVEDEGWRYDTYARFHATPAPEMKCHRCALFDILLTTKPGPGVVQVIADHVRYEHEPAG